MKKIVLFSFFLLSSILFLGCPDPNEEPIGIIEDEYPYWRLREFDNFNVSINLEKAESDDFYYAAKKNQQITMSFSGSLDSSKMGDIAILAAFYQKTTNYGYDEFADFEIKNPEGQPISRENNFCAFLCKPSENASETFEKKLNFSFSDAGKYKVYVYVDSAPKHYTEDDIKCFDVAHSYFQGPYYFMIKGEE